LVQNKRILGETMVSIRFEHGLGDCVNFAHQIPLYLRRGHRIQIQCSPDKEPVFRAAGAEIVGHAEAVHGWPHAAGPGRPDHDDPWSGNKAAANLSQQPLPDIGPCPDLWGEWCDVRLSLERFVTDGRRDTVDRWMASINGPLVCLHTMGNTSTESKNLGEEETLRLYRGLLDRTDATLLLLDWDNRVPRLASHRVRHLSHLGRIDLLTLYCVLQRAALLIGIDSGPLHFARLTACPAIGLWMHHFPSHFALPRRDTLHVVSQDWRDLAKFRRIEFQVLECPSGPRLDGDWAARVAAECLPTLGDPDWARRALLRQWMEWQRMPEGALGAYVDRHRSNEYLLTALSRPKPVMVETGCIRAEEDWGGAGFSTYFFGAAIERHGGRLHSVDFSPGHASFAEQWTRCFGSTVVVHVQHSHDFLRGWQGPIDVFLSDSADVGTDGYQDSCLVECQLAAPHVQPDGLIAIDDCVWNDGTWTGKGALAVPWLLEHGWRILYSGYQTLLGRSA
jgi:hypothetical protein